MRVLLLSPEFKPPGGIQYVARLMAAALHQRYAQSLRLDVVSLLDTSEPALETPVEHWQGCSGSRMGFAADAGRLLIRNRYDAVIVNHVHLLPLIAGTMVVRRQPVSLVVHGIEAWAPLPRWRLAGVGRVRRVLYASAFSRGRAEAANPPLRVRNGVVLHHGLIDSGGPVAVPSAGDPPMALMAGRMSAGERYKGFDEMIAIWPQVERKVSGAELWLAGDGDDRSRLETEARRRGIAARFLGRVSATELPILFDRCRCFCLPSRGEGFGLVYLEAMRAARPVLCGLDAATEIVGDGVTGRAVDPGDTDGLTEAVVELLGAKGRSMGEAGRARFLDRFTFDAYARRLGEAIEGGSTGTVRTDLIAGGTI